MLWTFPLPVLVVPFIEPSASRALGDIIIRDLVFPAIRQCSLGRKTTTGSSRANRGATESSTNCRNFIDWENSDSVLSTGHRTEIACTVCRSYPVVCKQGRCWTGRFSDPGPGSLYGGISRLATIERSKNWVAKATSPTDLLFADNGVERTEGVPNHGVTSSVKTWIAGPFRLFPFPQPVQSGDKSSPLLLPLPFTPPAADESEAEKRLENPLHALGPGL